MFLPQVMITMFSELRQRRWCERGKQNGRSRTIKKIVFTLFLVLVFAIPSFVSGDSHDITGPITGNTSTGSNNVEQYVGSLTTTGGSGGSVTIDPGAITATGGAGGAGGSVTNSGNSTNNINNKNINVNDLGT